MARKHENEFKVMIVELLNSGLPVKQVSDQYDLSGGMIRRWKKQYTAKDGDFAKKREPSTGELELKVLRKELREVTIERDILKKAVGIFSKSDR
jgi:transposase